MHINTESMHINTETATVTVTFEIGAWFFRATRRLDSPSMHKRITDRTWMVPFLHLNCLCDLWDRGVVLSHDTFSWYAKHFCQVTWKSLHAVQSYGPDTKKRDGDTKASIQTLKLQVWPWPLRQGRASYVWHVVSICKTLVQYYFKILPCIRKLQPGHESMHINTESMHINTETASVTLTFEIWVWNFYATHCLDMVNTFAKLF